MPKTAILLLDLQVDFLDTQIGRMPVNAAGGLRVIEAANAILQGELHKGSLPVLVVNKFSSASTVGNFFRNKAALAGSAGAALDPRIAVVPNIVTFSKQYASAFTNPDLEQYLRKEGVADIWVLGVFAEGCVRSTALDAQRRGFNVTVPEGEIATNSSWKAAFAAWSLKRGGVTVIKSIRGATCAA